GIWTFRGAYVLTDYRYELSPQEGRKVFKFLLVPSNEAPTGEWTVELDIDQAPERRIPGWVQQEVYKRDRGRCVKCGATTDLHFDHILPYSKGGSSRDPDNIQLLCARHNLEKGANFTD
ncbi:HNH endonuclease signature motif containing protein, partial [Tepidiforma sp.]|uniref:HNH endonuclease n=1 Tax=Tepidiforma sp. TaxID=2682230 RepID=UPI002619DE10